MPKSGKISKVIGILLGLSFLIRALIAGTLELGNDEVYYWTYAMFPDWSHFDHPPMVGWLIQVFTFNLRFDHEFFIRLGAVFCGTFAAGFIFLIGRNLRDERTGLFAAALYSASMYGSVVAGTFMLPDAGQMVFWVAALYFMTVSLTQDPETALAKRNILLMSIFAGLAMLSKYTSVFLWLGAIAYILTAGRRWLKSPYLYLGLAISFGLFLPVLYWNWKEHFVSFTFHGERVEVVQMKLRMDYFFTEVFGTILYQNPVNIGIILISLFSLWKGRLYNLSPGVKLVLWCSLPLAVIVPAVSFFRSTLPHWSGPAYAGLAILAGIWLSQRAEQQAKPPKFFPKALILSLGITLLSVVLGVLQVNSGLLYNKEEPKGSHALADPSLDLYGWKQLGNKFKGLYGEDLQQGVVKPGVIMLSWRWFPAANLDYYVAQPLGMKLYAEGSLERIHKYAWINQIRGEIPLGSDAYFITSARDFAEPSRYFGQQYKRILPHDTIAIERNGKRVMEYYVFILQERLP